MELLCKWYKSKLFTDDVTDSLSNPPLSALNGRDGVTQFPLAGKGSMQCLAVPGRTLWGREQAFMLMEKGLEVPKIELIPDQSLLVSLSFNSPSALTSCALLGLVLAPKLLGVAPFLAQHTSWPLKEIQCMEQLLLGGEAGGVHVPNYIGKSELLCQSKSHALLFTLTDESTPQEQSVVTTGADHTHPHVKYMLEF